MLGAASGNRRHLVPLRPSPTTLTVRFRGPAESTTRQVQTTCNRAPDEPIRSSAPSAAVSGPGTQHSLFNLNRIKELLMSPLGKAVLLAQGLSFLLAVMGTTSGLLVNRGINMPTTQSFLNYVLLALTCGGAHLRARGRTLRNPLHIYALLALLDVEGNYLVTKAYQYTSVTSVTLLDCFTIPAVMLLSWLWFRARYLPAHFSGAALCIAGLALLVLTDGTSATGGPNPVLGDALVLLGALAYATSNVLQERLLVETPVTELLGMIGCFGCIIGGIQALVLERGAWAAAAWSPAVIAPLLGFAVSLYAFSVLLPRVLIWSSATTLNLSLLTSDLWSAASRVAFFGGFGGTAGWFCLSLVMEALGLFIYTRAGEAHGHKPLACAPVPGAVDNSGGSGAADPEEGQRLIGSSHSSSVSGGASAMGGQHEEAAAGSRSSTTGGKGLLQAAWPHLASLVGRKSGDNYLLLASAGSYGSTDGTSRYEPGHHEPQPAATATAHVAAGSVLPQAAAHNGAGSGAAERASSGPDRSGGQHHDDGGGGVADGAIPLLPMQALAAELRHPAGKA